MALKDELNQLVTAHKEKARIQQRLADEAKRIWIEKENKIAVADADAMIEKLLLDIRYSAEGGRREFCVKDSNKIKLLRLQEHIERRGLNTEIRNSSYNMRYSDDTEKVHIEQFTLRITW